MTALWYLQHEVEVGDLLCRPAGVIISNLKPGLHSLDVGALLEEVLIGAVVLQQVKQQQQTVFHHNTCTKAKGCTSGHYITRRNNTLNVLTTEINKRCDFIKKV